MEQISIAIIGAGISGLTTALALAQKGFAHVSVYERAETLGEVGAGIQLGANAVRALKQLGIDETLAECSDSACRGYMREGETNRLLTQLPYSDYFQKAYASPAYQVLRSDLHGLILEQVLQVGVPVHTGQKLVSANYQSNPVRADFANGTVLEADLLIAADGIDSVVAHQMYPEYPNHFSGLVCWRALVDRNDLDSCLDSAFESVSVWIGPNKHLVAYPVANSSKLNLVAITARKDWDFSDSVQSSSIEDWLQAYADWSPDVLALISKARAPKLWGLFERPELPNWSRGSCVLIGDAAHPMLPSLAQGAAQGIEDSIILADLLSNMQDKKNLAETCKQFYELRHHRVERVQASARWNIDYFHKSKGFFLSCRNLAMRALGAITTGLIARRYHWLYRG